MFNFIEIMKFLNCRSALEYKLSNKECQEENKFKVIFVFI